MARIGETPDAVQQWRTGHAEVLRLAQQLRRAAVVFRRYSGELKYHPQTGVQGHVGQDLLDATSALRDTLDAIAAMTRLWDEEIAWLRSLDARMPTGDIQRGQAEARDAARLTRAALEIFEQAALHPEPASLDAPYGHGAPRRVHPGAQCTWVADRAEGLAVALSSVTLRMENLLRLTGSEAEPTMNPEQKLSGGGD